TSWLLIFLGIGYGFYRSHSGKTVFGVDFVGGDTTTFSFEHRVDEANVRTALVNAGVKDPVIQYEKDPSSKRESLRVVSETGTGEKVVAALRQLPGAGLSLLSQDHVGATVGEEIRRSAIIASLLSLFGILVYVAFRYEFSFAVGAVLAVIHDVLMTIGC